MLTGVAADFLQLWEGGYIFIRLLIKGNPWNSAAFGFCYSLLTGDTLFYVSLCPPQLMSTESGIRM